ncbi:hypothetical protein [Eleftheria terrae]|uniref:hypothetical protein n=1 Tax=Eleftheria terrae TaxID=1597781 RepID=UPI00263B13AF|nr:hypothetical protein [Eleftheria terrae]WKB54117.1 hypothetical protein N7L95_06920 [Eleftheria terrae]
MSHDLIFPAGGRLIEGSGNAFRGNAASMQTFCLIGGGLYGPTMATRKAFAYTPGQGRAGRQTAPLLRAKVPFARSQTGVAADGGEPQGNLIVRDAESPGSEKFFSHYSPYKNFPVSSDRICRSG